MLSTLIQVNSNTVVKIFGGTAPCDFTHCMIVFIVIMIVMGIFGGVVNYFLTDGEAIKDDKPKVDDSGSGNLKENDTKKTPGRLLKCIVLGLAGSFLIPLFLKMFSRFII